MNRNRIREEDIRLGEPLPWPVYDRQGVLLLRKGYVIGNRSQLQALVARGLYTGGNPGPQPPSPAEGSAVRSPFHIFDAMQVRLRRICEDIKAGAPGELPLRVPQFCQDLQRLCRMDADAVLGAVHLIHEGRYTIIHALHTAILSELFLRVMGISDEDRVPILAAALTKDVGMMDFQDTMYSQAAPLTEAQRAQVRQHPGRSVAMLEAIGVIDGLWLDTVLHHHERLDGSGYPDGLVDEDIFFPVRVLAIVDIYGALIKRRAYRGALTAREALRDLFLERAGAVDTNLAKIFIKELGIFPPGAFVRLRNSEVAVVTHRGKNGGAAIVQTVVGPRGAPLPKPIRRDTGADEFSIREIVIRDGAVLIDPHLLWGYR